MGFAINEETTFGAIIERRRLEDTFQWKTYSGPVYVRECYGVNFCVIEYFAIMWSERKCFRNNTSFVSSRFYFGHFVFEVVVL